MARVLGRLLAATGMLVFAGCSGAKDSSPGGSDTDSDTDTDSDSDSDTDSDTDTDADPILLTSGGGGSTVTHLEGEYVEEDCPTDCSANTAPTLDPVMYLVNGTVTTTLSATAGDEVAVLVGYADAECNLSCGSQYYGWQSPEGSEADAGSLPSNVPCDTASSNVYLGFDLGIVESGDYSISLKVVDVCGGETPRVEESFSVP